MKNVQIKFFILIFLLMLLLPINVFATQEIILQADKEYLEIGEEITVSAKLSSEIKLYALTASLNYDQTVFEAISSDNFTSADPDEEVIYNAKNNKFGFINKSGEISENLLTVHLKVKKNANIGKTTISLTNVQSSDGDNKFTYPNSSVTALVTRDAEEGEVVPANKSDDTVNRDETDKAETTIKTFTTKPIMIATGITSGILILACIAVNILKIKNRGLINRILVSLIICSVVATVSLYVVNINKKDVNNDGVKNYDDAKEIIKYLIDMEGTKPNEDENNENNENIIGNENNNDTANKESNSSSAGKTNNNKTVASNNSTGSSSNSDIDGNDNNNTDNNNNNENNTNTGDTGNNNNNGNTNDNDTNDNNDSNNDNNNDNKDDSNNDKDDNNNNDDNNDNKNDSNNDKDDNNNNDDNNDNKDDSNNDKNDNNNNDDNNDNKDDSNNDKDDNNNNNNDEDNKNTGDNDKDSKDDNDNKDDFDHDVDNDGDVDINDAGGSTQDTTDKTNYKVELSKLDEDNTYYLRKQEHFILGFNAKVTNDVRISDVTIDGVVYPAIKNGSMYTVSLNAPNEAGIHNFVISSVTLSNGRKIDTKLTIEKDILKDVPYVDMFTIDDENNTLSFKLEDKDNAFIDGTLLVLDNENKEVINKQVEKENHIVYQFEEDINYTIIVTGAYDLDNNINEDKNAYQNQELYRHTFSVTKNYNFKINNISITDAIEIGQKPTISFDSTNSKGIDVEYIVVDNKQYIVTLKNENHYEVILDQLDTSTFGKFYINIDKVVLDNLKDFKKDTDYSSNDLIYNVLKNAPTVSDINITNNTTSKNVSVAYNFKDTDSTLQSLTAVLTDSTNKIIDSKENINTNESVTLSYEKSSDGRYTVKFLADYNLGTDRHTYIDKNIGEKEVLTQTDIVIERARVTTVFPTKNQPKYKINYVIKLSDDFIEKNKTTTKYNKISSITINGLNYAADQNNDEIKNDADKDKKMCSSVSFTVPSESGILELEVSRIQLQFEDYNHNSREFFSVAPYKTTIDVLKDKPTIKNLEVISENYNENNVTFKFDVIDDKGGFQNGKVKLGEEIQTINTSGTNTVTFTNVAQDVMSELKFFGSYDLHTKTLTVPDTDKTKYEYIDEPIYTTQYGLYDNTKYDNMKLVNLKAVSSNGNEYFEKNENIKLEFTLEGLDSGLDFTIDKIIIQGKEYKAEKTEQGYITTIDGYTGSGRKDIKITGLVLNTGRKVTLTEPATIEIEILKDPITMEDFIYTVYDNDINMTFVLKDSDKSVQDNLADKIKVKVFNEDGNELYTLNYNDSLQFAKKENILRYYIKVFADYDRDISKTNKQNEYQNQIILDDVISLDKSNIELKDILEITLYKAETSGNTTIASEVNVEELKANINSYFVKISMKEMPTIYTKIKNVLVENEKLILVLDYEYVTKENEKEKKDIRIIFGNVHDGYVKNEVNPETLPQLLEKIKADPTGTYKLERDLDVSEYTDEELVNLGAIDFKGKLNGNGYTIKNLNKPLFNSLSNATVENISFNKVRLPSTNARGSLSNTATDSIVKNILIDDFVKSNSEDQTGSLIGIVNNNCVIENCRVINLNLNVIWNKQQVGGLIGCIQNSEVNNCYAVGTISGGYNFKSGLVGNVNVTATLNNCYAKVNLTGNNGSSFGIASSYRGTIVANNCVCLSTGYSDGIFSGNLKANQSSNNYEVTDKEVSLASVTKIGKEQINRNFFVEQAKFDEQIWNLRDVSYDLSPTLNIEKVSKINIDEVKEEYSEEKETLYNNLIMLMPFYDSTKIVKSAQGIDSSNPLYTQEIVHIVPVDSNGNIVTYLTNNEPDKIKKIKIVFKDNTKKEYEVRYDNTYDMVANYRINELKIDYTFNHYIIDNNSWLTNNLTNYLLGITYEDNLNKLTPTVDDSRILSDYYNEVTKQELKEFVLKYLSNSNYTNTSNDEAIDDYLEKEIKKDQKLEKLLYVYNYFRRFYDLDIEGIKLYDLILFDSQGFNKNMNPTDIVSDFLSNDNNVQLNATNDTYNRLFAKYTNCDTIAKFLKYIVTEFSSKKIDNEEMSKWVASQFKGYILEVKVDSRPDIMYSLWDHFSNPDANYGNMWRNYVLPILTLPENAGYVLSTPTQFIIGAQRTYISNPDDPKEQAEFQRRVKQYADRMKDYYTTASQLLEDDKYFNNIHTIQIDKRYTFDTSGNTIFQNPYTTEEPFHKNFNEVVGSWAYNDYNAATANGSAIIWRVEGIFDGKFDDGYEYTFHTWSHETAHNIDARLFLKDNGRRFDAGGEDYADSNLMQAFGDGDIVMNFSRDLTNVSEKDYISSNLTPERINSTTKVWDFYSKLFNTVYILDYLEGEAFLDLTAEEQSKLAVQVSYPNENQYTIDENSDTPYPYYKNYLTTVYQTISEQAISKMNLETIDDLYKNKLVMYPGVIYSTIIDNRYGGENIYKVRWYQPHNNYGRPDSYSIKWFAYEMLGYKGYDNGYIEYFSNINSMKKTFAQVDNNGDYARDNNGNIKTSTVNYKTDLMALRTITDNKNMTFETYKKSRFDYVKQNLKNIQIIDVNKAYLDFYNALKADAENVKKVEKEAWEKYPDANNKDQTTKRNNMIAEARKYPNSTEVRRQLFYELKNKTNDFEGKVYDVNNPHEVAEFIPPKVVEPESESESEPNVVSASELEPESEPNIASESELEPNVVSESTIQAEQEVEQDSQTVSIDNQSSTIDENIYNENNIFVENETIDVTSSQEENIIEQDTNTDNDLITNSLELEY